MAKFKEPTLKKNIAIEKNLYPWESELLQRGPLLAVDKEIPCSQLGLLLAAVPSLWAYGHHLDITSSSMLKPS